MTACTCACVHAPSKIHIPKNVIRFRINNIEQCNSITNQFYCPHSWPFAVAAPAEQHLPSSWRQANYAVFACKIQWMLKIHVHNTWNDQCVNMLMVLWTRLSFSWEVFFAAAAVGAVSGVERWRKVWGGGSAWWCECNFSIRIQFALMKIYLLLKHDSLRDWVAMPFYCDFSDTTALTHDLNVQLIKSYRIAPIHFV